MNEQELKRKAWNRVCRKWSTAEKAKRDFIKNKREELGLGSNYDSYIEKSSKKELDEYIESEIEKLGELE